MRLLICFCLFICSQANSQQTYSFDKILTYDYVENDSVYNTSNHYINSKNNNYFFYTWDLRRKYDTILINFIDKHKVNSINRYITKDFIKSDTINITNQYVIHICKSYDIFDVIQLKDSIIDNKLCNHYVLRLKNKRKEKRLKNKKKLFTEHYFTTKDNVPTVSYLVCNKTSNKMRGFVYTRYSENKEIPNRIIHKRVLRKITPIKKFLIRNPLTNTQRKTIKLENIHSIN